MRKRILLGLALLIVLLLALLAYVALPARNDLLQARNILSGPLEDLSDENVREAKDSIDQALGRLRSIPARILNFVPVAGRNLQAVEDVAGRVPPALDAGLRLKNEVEQLEKGGVFSKGRVRVDALAALRAPLEDEVDALEALEQELTESRSGYLWPSTWESFDDLLYEVTNLRRDSEGLAGVLDSLGPMLGTGSKRTYLTLLMNNAELRGAGGILTGIGTLTAQDGRLETSGFTSVHALRTEKSHKVPVPEDFERFRIYKANDTALFLNATYSPDVPDVAIVAARLYERVTGVETQGAIAVDPRGVAALMPADAELSVPGSNRTVATGELAEFIYSDAYEIFTDQQERRDAILDVGTKAFETILDADLDDQEDLQRVAEAFKGGHLRVVSFDEEEQSALEAVDAAGDFESDRLDSVHVAVQNRGGAPGIGSKMDYWSSRTVTHGCEMTTETEMSCSTNVTITNEAPKGLPDYVTGGGKPYGQIHDFVEVFVPAAAEVNAVELDDKETPLVVEEQADRTSLGMSTTIPRGAKTRIETAYTLPVDEGYSLLATPQPLAKDAQIKLSLELPTEWTVRGPGRWEDGIFRYEGTFDEPLEITAGPADLTGLPALWESLKRFWREPLF